MPLYNFRTTNLRRGLDARRRLAGKFTAHTGILRVWDSASPTLISCLVLAAERSGAALLRHVRKDPIETDFLSSFFRLWDKYTSPNLGAYIRQRCMSLVKLLVTLRHPLSGNAGAGQPSCRTASGRAKVHGGALERIQDDADCNTVTGFRKRAVPRPTIFFYQDPGFPTAEFDVPPSDGGEALPQEVEAMEFENPASPHANDDATRWFAVYTAPNHEKRVAEMIMTREIETFLPLYRTTRQWKKRPLITLELPLFPSYLFVRVTHRERGPVLSTPGVLAFVGNGRHAISVPDSEIDALRNGIEQYAAEPHSFLAVGESVRVMAGPFAGYTGTLVRNKTGARVVLTIDAIMQGVAVEIDSSILEPATPGCGTDAPSKAQFIM
jgi:transcription antitermination factor NusG